MTKDLIRKSKKILRYAQNDTKGLFIVGLIFIRTSAVAQMAVATGGAPPSTAPFGAMLRFHQNEQWDAHHGEDEEDNGHRETFFLFFGGKTLGEGLFGSFGKELPSADG